MSILSDISITGPAAHSPTTPVVTNSTIPLAFTASPRLCQNPQWREARTVTMFGSFGQCPWKRHLSTRPPPQG